MYEFNALSNRLLQTDFNDFNRVLSKFVRFLENTEIIHEYIIECGDCDQDMDLEFKEVRSRRAIFDIGETTEEEVRNVYAILKYIVDHNLDVSFGVGMSYSTGPKYQDILKAFNNRVTWVLIQHIETYLTKVGIDMGLDDNISYNIDVKNGQVNIANDNAVINATNSNDEGIDTKEFLVLLEKIRETAKESDLSPSDEESVFNSLEVIEEEVQSKRVRKGFLKTAINGLKVIKGTAEFGAAVAALIQFIQLMNLG